MDKIEFIKKLTELLGVEINQPFQIGYNLFVFTEDGLMAENKGDWNRSYLQLNTFIDDIGNIIKDINDTKFPKKGTKMYCPGIYPEISEFIWDGNKEQVNLFINRLCFTDKESALQKRTFIINDNSGRF